MERHLILSVLSDDRPGVIKQIAEVVTRYQGNWLESRLTQLAGKFAGVIRVKVPDAQVPALQETLGALKTNGIRVLVEDLQNSASPTATGRAIFTVLGPDRPGIVLEIAQALTRYNINIADLNTNCSSTPYSGEPLFAADGVLNVPKDTDLDQLSAQLAAIADALGIDITLEQDALGELQA